MNHIETTVDSNILEIKINRPEKFNALSPEMYQDISRALYKLDSDPSLRVGLIYATGKHFSAGIELDRWSEYFESGSGFPTPKDGLDPFALSGKRCRKPLVFAAQGYCYTWGVELMLTTDVRIASMDTSFGMLEVTRGIFPCGGATIRLPKQMGWANAQRYLLTGETWNAEEAFRTGLIQNIVPAEQVYSTARAHAEKISAAAPLAVQAVLRSSRIAEKDETQATQSLFGELQEIMKSQDAAEGIQSFIERRKGIFTGK